MKLLAEEELKRCQKWNDDVGRANIYVFGIDHSLFCVVLRSVYSLGSSPMLVLSTTLFAAKTKVLFWWLGFPALRPLLRKGILITLKTVVILLPLQQQLLVSVAKSTLENSLSSVLILDFHFLFQLAVN